MYHYVGGPDPQCTGGIVPLRPEQFVQQIELLQQRYQIVRADELVEFVEDGWGPAERLCLLTFDDGTADQARVAAPLLAERGLSAVIFVLTEPLAEGRIPRTHKLHIVLGRVGDEELWDRSCDWAQARLAGGLAELGEAEQAGRMYHYETGLRGRIKYAVNFALPGERADELMDELFAKTCGCEAEWAGRWFVRPGELEGLERMGMVIASHGHGHILWREGGQDGWREDVETAHRHLAAWLGHEPRWFSPPFGASGLSAEARAGRTGQLRGMGYRGVVLTEAGVNRVPIDPLRLRRMDAASLPPVKRIRLAYALRG